MIVEMKDIYKSFGKNHVLQGVDFKLGENEIHALVGENGAGKSTLMNILSGVLEKDKGKILQGLSMTRSYKIFLLPKII